MSGGARPVLLTAQRAGLGGVGSPGAVGIAAGGGKSNEEDEEEDVGLLSLPTGGAVLPAARYDVGGGAGGGPAPGSATRLTLPPGAARPALVPAALGRPAVGGRSPVSAAGGGDDDSDSDLYQPQLGVNVLEQSNASGVGDGLGDSNNWSMTFGSTFQAAVHDRARAEADAALARMDQRGEMGLFLGDRDPAAGGAAVAALSGLNVAGYQAGGGKPTVNRVDRGVMLQLDAGEDDSSGAVGGAGGFIRPVGTAAGGTGSSGGGRPGLSITAHTDTDGGGSGISSAGRIRPASGTPAASSVSRTGARPSSGIKRLGEDPVAYRSGDGAGSRLSHADDIPNLDTMAGSGGAGGGTGGGMARPHSAVRGAWYDETPADATDGAGEDVLADMVMAGELEADDERGELEDAASEGEFVYVSVPTRPSVGRGRRRCPEGPA